MNICTCCKGRGVVPAFEDGKHEVCVRCEGRGYARHFFLLPFHKIEIDGCSGGLSYWWQRIFHERPPFEECCCCHDIEYHYGSGVLASPWENFKERLWVDNQFFLCLWRHSVLGKFLAPFLWLAVRLGGGSYWRRPYSWGFGWRK